MPNDAASPPPPASPAGPNSPPADGSVDRQHMAFPAFEQMHLLSYMNLADTKAAVFLAMSTSAIAYLVARYGLTWLKLENISRHIVLLPVAVIFLAISATYAVAVIVPRLVDPESSIIHFRAIARHKSNRRYVEDLLARTPAALFEEQMAYCYDLAVISRRKYQLLNRSLIAGVLGYATFLATLIFV